MPLPDQTVDAMQKALFSLSGFAELVEYRPAGGSPVQIRAVVERNLAGPSFVPGTDRNLTEKSVKVTIPNRPDWGRTTVSERDRILLALKFGDPPAECRILGRTSGDEVSFTVRVGE